MSRSRGVGLEPAHRKLDHCRSEVPRFADPGDTGGWVVGCLHRRREFSDSKGSSSRSFAPATYRSSEAPRCCADVETTELAPRVFAELGLSIDERMTPQAMLTFAKQEAQEFTTFGANRRGIAAGFQVHAKRPAEYGIRNPPMCRPLQPRTVDGFYVGGGLRAVRHEAEWPLQAQRRGARRTRRARPTKRGSREKFASPRRGSRAAQRE